MKTVQDIQELLAPKQSVKNSLDNAVLHTQRCRFHAEGLPDAWWVAELNYVSNQIWNKEHNLRNRYNGYVVLQKAYEMLSIDKFHKFLANFSICTTNIVNRVKTEMQRIFFALNGHETYKFKKDDLFADWQMYRDYIACEGNDKEFFTKEGIDLLIRDFNSLLLIDLEQDEELLPNELPKPYYKIIGIDRVVNIECEKNEIEFVVFRKEDGFLYVDDEIVCEFDKDKKLIGEPYEHNLGVIPCKFVSNLNRFVGDYIQKKGLLSDVLDELDNLVLFEVNARYMYFANSFPITYAYEQDCTYKQEDNFTCDKNQCVFSRNIDNVPVFYKKNCACKESKLVGAGSFIEVPVPQEGVTPAMMPPVGQLAPEVTSLQFVSDKVANDSEILLNMILGGSTQTSGEQAKNELQVNGNFESRKATLMLASYTIQTLWNFANNFVATVRYGEDFIAGHIQLGDEFFLANLESLQEQFEKAKVRGDISELQSLQDQINYYKQKYNKTNLLRAKVIQALTPFQYQSNEELLTYLQNQVITRDEFRYTLLLPKLIEKFEYSINADIVQFGESLDFAEKIKRIETNLKQLFNEYEKENRPEPTGIQGTVTD